MGLQYSAVVAGGNIFCASAAFICPRGSICGCVVLGNKVALKALMVPETNVEKEHLASFAKQLWAKKTPLA